LEARRDRRSPGHGGRKFQGTTAPRARPVARTAGGTPMTTSDIRTQSMRTESELRLQCSGLRREIEPAHDLWQGIQARIGQLPAQARAPARGNPATRLAPWALAASLVLAVGVAWRMQPPPASTPAADGGTGAPAIALDREA